MRLARPLVQIPLRIDAGCLVAELAAIPESAWRAHPEGAPGNTAVPVVAAGGDAANDSTVGPMAPTPVLAELPYTRQVLAALDATIGRARFMRIAEETELAAHVDVNYYWWHHLRVHVPIVTTPDVVFEVEGTTVNMSPGEVWIFDTWRRHRVDNRGSEPRIHLVIDTVGSAGLWDLVDDPDREPVVVQPDAGATPLLPLETVNHPVVMTPFEVNATLDDLLGELEAVDVAAAARVRHALAPFRRAWRGLFAQYGTAPQGWRLYAELVDHGQHALVESAGEARLSNGVALVDAVRQLVFGVAVNPHLAAEVRPVAASAVQQPTSADIVRAQLAGPPRITEPIFIVSQPRSGSSLLFETLARAPGLFTVGGESHLLIEGIPALRPESREWTSNRLVAEDATEGVVAALKDQFVHNLRDRAGARAIGGPTRMLEKTPKNALRVPFLAAAFPDARFVFLYRDPRETISSMLDAWRSGRFVTYPDLPGWGGIPWSLLLVPGWESLDGRALGEVVTEQWSITTNVLLDDLEALDPGAWCVASYDRLVADPKDEVAQLCAFLDLPWDDPLAEPLPESRHTLDAPRPEKWRRNAEELQPHESRIADMARRARALFAAAPRVEPITADATADRPRRRAHGGDGPAGAAVDTAGDAVLPGGDELFQSQHTGRFLRLLHEWQSSLVVTTYQAGRLILLRAGADSLNTHFRSLASPMGVAFDGHRLAVGTGSEIVLFQNQPDLGRRVEPPGLHDACFVTRTRHSTGDIRVHDLAWGDDGLWVVNTRFSCLATLDGDHSFVPRWRPPFITALAPEDRCHLNGLAMVDGQPRYVTVLGITDEPGGWREHKAHGGAIIDVITDATVAVGLSMPHSPRWHQGRLWVLESGIGALCTVDVETGAVEQVARVPGFARGLAFVGKHAIIGLSRVREHAFDGLPLTQARADELRCGVWIVDVTTGETVAHLAFEGLVQEIFEVALLTGMRYPELVEPGAPLAESAYVLPSEALAQVPQDR